MSDEVTVYSTHCSLLIAHCRASIIAQSVLRIHVNATIDTVRHASENVPSLCIWTTSIRWR